MNRIYKAIFSKSKGCYVVVSELRKSAQKQKSNKSSLMKLTVASIILLPLVTTVYAVEPRAYQTLAGYIEGDIIYNNDGKELINLGEIKKIISTLKMALMKHRKIQIQLLGLDLYRLARIAYRLDQEIFGQI